MRISIKDAEPVSLANGWQIVHDTVTGTRIYWNEEKNEWTTNQDAGTVIEATAQNTYETAELIRDEQTSKMNEGVEDTEQMRAAFILPIIKIDPRAPLPVSPHYQPHENAILTQLCLCRCPVHGNKIQVVAADDVHIPIYRSEDPVWRCQKCGDLLPFEDDGHGNHKIDCRGICNGNVERSENGKKMS